MSDFELDYFEFRFSISVVALHVQITNFFNMKQTTTEKYFLTFTISFNLICVILSIGMQQFENVQLGIFLVPLNERSE